jgi:hypothetical protein
MSDSKIQPDAGPEPGLKPQVGISFGTDRPSTLSRERVRGRSWVRFSDRLAESVITLGGLAVLAAMLGICVFLVSSAAPLFRGGEVVGELGSGEALVASAAPAEVWVANTRDVACVVDADGVLRLVRLTDGAVLGSRRIAPEDRDVTAWSRIAGPEGALALGFDDGSFAVYEIAIERNAVRPDELPASINARLSDGFVANLTDEERGAIAGVLLRTDTVGVEAAVVPGEDGPVVWSASVTGGQALEIAGAASSPVATIGINGVSVRRRFVAAMLEDGSSWFGVLSARQRLDGGPPLVSLRTFEMGVETRGELDSESRSETSGVALGEDVGHPQWLFVAADGGSVYALWPDATGHRIDSSSPRNGFPIVEQLVLGDRALTTAAMTLGGTTLALGDEAGRVTTVFTVPAPVGGSVDNKNTVVVEPLSVLGWRSHEPVAEPSHPRGALRRGGRVVWHGRSDQRQTRRVGRQRSEQYGVQPRSRRGYRDRCRRDAAGQRRRSGVRCIRWFPCG